MGSITTAIAFNSTNPPGAGIFFAWKKQWLANQPRPTKNVKSELASFFECFFFTAIVAIKEIDADCERLEVVFGCSLAQLACRKSYINYPFSIQVSR